MKNNVRRNRLYGKELRKEFDFAMLEAAQNAEVEQYVNAAIALFGPGIVNNEHFRSQVAFISGEIADDPNLRFVTDPIEVDQKVHSMPPEHLDKLRECRIDGEWVPRNAWGAKNVVVIHYPVGNTTWRKRRTSKWKRRMAKRYLQDAPPDNRYRGWAW